MLFFFAVDQRHAFGIDWSAVGAANAGEMQAGAWWQAITALTLHAGVRHLLGNLGFGVLFGLLAAPVLGSGLAWLTTLLAGGLGNALNALLQPPDHTAVGASTALFGTVGILATHAWLTRPVRSRGGLRRFAPLGGGVMLLAFLGFGGKDVDIGAHVLGFLAGGAIGVGLVLGGSYIPQGRNAQRTYARCFAGDIGPRLDGGCGSLNGRSDPAREGLILCRGYHNPRGWKRSCMRIAHQ